MAKNSDYVIYITTSHDQTWSHVKEGDGWTRTGPNGRVHRMSAEQLLSHLLPPLVVCQCHSEGSARRIRDPKAADMCLVATDPSLRSGWQYSSTLF